MYNIVHNICATLDNTVCKVERNIVDNALYNVVFNVLQTLHDIVINSLYNVACNVMHCEFCTIFCATLWKTVCCTNMWSIVHYVCAKFYMYSIGRNVELNIVKRVNNIVPIIVQHCITLGVTYFVQWLPRRLATYLTGAWTQRSTQRNQCTKMRERLVRSTLHIICIIVWKRALNFAI